MAKDEEIEMVATQIKMYIYREKVSIFICISILFFHFFFFLLLFSPLVLSKDILRISRISLCPTFLLILHSFEFLLKMPMPIPESESEQNLLPLSPGPSSSLSSAPSVVSSSFTKTSSTDTSSPTVSSSSSERVSDTEFNAIIRQSQELCEEVNPEKEPFRSRYKARELLEGLKVKLVSSSSVSSSSEKIETATAKASSSLSTLSLDDSERKSSIGDLYGDGTKKEDLMIAKCDYRIGKIGLETEEYHTADKYLTQAMQVFLPSLLSEINVLVPVDSSGDEEVNEQKTNYLDYEKLNFPASIWPLQSLSQIIGSHLEPSDVSQSSTFISSCYEDILDMLNQMGILWCNRGNSKRSLLYLLASEFIHEKYQHEKNAETKSKTKPGENLYVLHTFTLFYLAQVYGGLNEAAKSAKYCILTLERELPSSYKNDSFAKSRSDDNARELKKTEAESKFNDNDNDNNYDKDINTNTTTFDAYTWCKNCLGLFEYFMTVQNSPLDAFTTLLAVEKVLEFAPSPSKEKSKEESTEEESEDIQCLKADIQRRYAHFYSWIMKKAFDEQLNFSYNGFRLEVDSTPELAATKNEFTMDHVNNFQSLLQDSDSARKEIQEIFNFLYVREDEVESESTNNGNGTGIVVKEEEKEEKEKFYFTFTKIKDFDQARQLFLKLIAALNKAMKYFVLDGFVTDHVNLCIQQSQAYKYLIIFEAEEKRRIAMYLRRIGILKTPLNEISSSAYVGLHKSLSFEIGEIYMELLDMKISRIEAKQNENQNKTQGQSTSMTFPKKSDIEKVHGYCAESIQANEHFVSLYIVDNEESNNNDNKTTKTIKVEKDELLPYLRSHFHLARLYGRQNLYGSLSDRVEATKQCLAKYEWLLPYAKQQISRHYQEENKQFEKEGGKTVFQEELLIMAEMIKILPEKINRMMHHGQRFSI